MAKFDPVEVLTRFIAGERDPRINAVLRKLPASVDPKLAGDGAQRLLEKSPGEFARTCQKVPVWVIRDVLARESTGAHHLFLRLAVQADFDDATLVASWQEALAVMRDFDTRHAWDSRETKQKIRELAADARMLQAMQGTCAMAKRVPLEMLAVLAADGSEASIDGLIPHLDPALASGDGRLDQMSMLRAHAGTSARIAELLGEVDQRLHERRAASPALALGPVIGLGPVTELWFSVSLRSVELNQNNVWRIQGDLDVDSRAAIWFRVSLSDLRPERYEDTSFSNDKLYIDQLQLGSCAPEQLPAWLANSAKHLSITWKPFALRRGVRGKRPIIARWLAGG